MKKLSVAFVGVLSLLCSCDFLDLEPETEWTGESPKNREQLYGILNGGYRQLGVALQQGFLYYGDARADVYLANLTSGMTQDKVLRSNLDVNLSYANWSNFYTVIKQANSVLYHAPRLLEQDLIGNEESTAAKKEAARVDAMDYIGQAYCQRAFAYFWIVRIWGDAPVITKPVLKADEELKLTRTPANEVLEFILGDLELALQYMKPQTTNPTRVRFSPWAARAIMAHVYMWQATTLKDQPAKEKVCYEKALEVLNATIPTSETSTLFRLADLYDPAITIRETNATDRFLLSNKGFVKLFNHSGGDSETEPESIFELSFSVEDGDDVTIWDTWYKQSSTTFKVREDFVDDFYNLGDYRFFASIERASSNKRNARKWTATQDWARGDARNIVLIRLADLILLRAEANIMIADGSYTAATRDAIMTDINRIRKRAMGDAGVIAAEEYATYTHENFLERVKSERRFELAFEGHRWFDLVRWGDVITTLASLQPAQNATWVWDTGPIQLNPLAIVWPIHINEIRRSPEIIQNEFYR